LQRSVEFIAFDRIRSSFYFAAQYFGIRQGVRYWGFSRIMAAVRMSAGPAAMAILHHPNVAAELAILICPASRPIQVTVIHVGLSPTRARPLPIPTNAERPPSPKAAIASRSGLGNMCQAI
jgi:hypothetical protein